MGLCHEDWSGPLSACASGLVYAELLRGLSGAHRRGLLLREERARRRDQPQRVRDNVEWAWEDQASPRGADTALPMLKPAQLSQHVRRQTPTFLPTGQPGQGHCAHRCFLSPGRSPHSMGIFKSIPNGGSGAQYKKGRGPILKIKGVATWTSTP